MKIIIFYETDVRYSISTKNEGKICLKDIVLNANLDLLKLYRSFYSAIGLVFSLDCLFQN